ncbi:hypothetical protein CM50_14460 [Bacillus subtilis]|nr:hypothetical protein CM50_14460 [Bacillus subtilis] [Bacillus stercoris]
MLLIAGDVGDEAFCNDVVGRQAKRFHPLIYWLTMQLSSMSSPALKKSPATSCSEPSKQTFFPCFT